MRMDRKARAVIAGAITARAFCVAGGGLAVE